jgi:outer membrane biosynthesis protein TonB
MRTLNHDTREIAKVISNVSQQIEVKRWNVVTKKQRYSEKGVFMKCIQRRPQVIPIEELKQSPECKKLIQTMNVLVEKFQTKAQDILTNYLKEEIKHYEEQRFTKLETNLRTLVRLHSTEVVTKLNEKKRMQMLLRGTANRNKLTIDEVSGFAYLFLLTGEACTSLMEWAEIDNANNMMKALTRSLAFPKRIVETKTRDSNSVKIGNLTFTRPGDEAWNVATSIATDLHELVAEMTLGAKTGFYNTIMKSKGNKAVRDMRYTKETIDRTAAVTGVLLNANNIKERLDEAAKTKDLYNKIYSKLTKKNVSLDRYSKALGIHCEEKEEKTQKTKENVKYMLKEKEKNNDIEQQERPEGNKKIVPEGTQEQTIETKNNKNTHKKQRRKARPKHKHTKNNNNEINETNEKSSTNKNNSNNNINNNNNSNEQIDETTTATTTITTNKNYQGKSFDPDYHLRFQRDNNHFDERNHHNKNNRGNYNNDYNNEYGRETTTRNGGYYNRNEQQQQHNGTRHMEGRHNTSYRGGRAGGRGERNGGRGGSGRDGVRTYNHHYDNNNKHNNMLNQNGKRIHDDKEHNNNEKPDKQAKR